MTKVSGYFLRSTFQYSNIPFEIVTKIIILILVNIFENSIKYRNSYTILNNGVPVIKDPE